MSTFERYPMLSCLFYAAFTLGPLVWMFTHEACTHPVENMIAFFAIIAAHVIVGHWLTD